MLELACRDLVFHFNKKHLEDASIPMWTIKTRGKSYYVNHVSANMPWSTKETPDNTSTKGSIKFKNVHLKIDQENCAELRTLTSFEAARLRAKENGFTRIIITWLDKVQDFINKHEIKFMPFKMVSGSCGTRYYICDIVDPNDVVLMKLSLGPECFRILNENERMYMAYDDPALLDEMNANEEAGMYEDENED